MPLLPSDPIILLNISFNRFHNMLPFYVYKTYFGILFTTWNIKKQYNKSTNNPWNLSPMSRATNAEHCISSPGGSVGEVHYIIRTPSPVKVGITLEDGMVWEGLPLSLACRFNALNTVVYFLFIVWKYNHSNDLMILIAMQNYFSNTSTFSCVFMFAVVNLQ